MTESTYLKMNKPEYSDQYDLQHWNENTDIVDGAYNRIVNTGETVVKKAQQDESGNNIKSTYATKTELSTTESEINTSLGQKEVTANKVSAWQATPDNTHYPTEKLVKDGLNGKSNVGHIHNISDVTNLQSSLNGKSNTGHTHTKSDITNFPSSMPASDVYSWAKASSKPSYSISEISGVADKLLSAIYPVGSVYLSVMNTSPASFLGGTWKQLSAGYALWTATSGADATIDAGLPNITGNMYGDTCRNNLSTDGFVSATKTYTAYGGEKGNTDMFTITFNASKSNSIYGKSSTVQPPAYKIYAWKRTA